MTKLEEYKALNKNVRDSRRQLRDAKLKITHVFETVDWADYGKVDMCINVYTKMAMPWFSKSSFEDIEFTKHCECFDCHKLCQNTNCKYEEQNWDAVAAQFAYDDARAARRAFIGNLFRVRKK